VKKPSTCSSSAFNGKKSSTCVGENLRTKENSKVARVRRKKGRRKKKEESDQLWRGKSATDEIETSERDMATEDEIWALKGQGEAETRKRERRSRRAPASGV